MGLGCSEECRVFSILDRGAPRKRASQCIRGTMRSCELGKGVTAGLCSFWEHTLKPK